jgi:hypothetical protein
MTGTLRRALGGVLALLTLTAPLVSGCSAVDPDRQGARAAGPPAEVPGDIAVTGEPTDDDFDAITVLLAARAQAARSRDRKAFLATVDPKQPRLVAQQRTLYDNLARLDLTRMSYSVDRETLLVAADVPGEAPAFRPRIDEYVELAGTMQEPVVNPVQMTFVRRGSGWYLGAENQRKNLDSYESPQERPWFGGPIAVARSGEMTVLVDRERASTTGELIESIRADIAYAADVVDERPAYDVLVDATSNGHSVGFSHLTEDEAAAVYFGMTGSTGGLAGAVIKINPGLVAEALEQEGLMRHELTHFLLNEYAGSVPRWLGEGVASYVQWFPSDFSRLVVGDALYDDLMAADRRLPIVGLFATDPSVNYPISQAAVTWLTGRSGIARLKRLMEAYDDAYDGPDVDAHTPRLLRKVYGLREKDVVDGAFAELAKLHH